MTVPEFRPLFEDAWRGYPEDVKEFAWVGCFKDGGNGQISERAVLIYKMLKGTKPPYQPTS